MKNLSFILISIFPQFCFAQSSEIKYVACKGDTFIININFDNKDTVFNYEEGFFHSFVTNKAALFVFFCGSLNKSTFTSKLHYNTLISFTNNDRTVNFGIDEKNNTYWREDKFNKKGVVLQYYNVTFDEIDLLNKTMDKSHWQ